MLMMLMTLMTLMTQIWQITLKILKTLKTDTPVYSTQETFFFKKKTAKQCSRR
jgi:competence protein ComGF